MPEQTSWEAAPEGRSSGKLGSFGRYMTEKRERALRSSVADCLLRAVGTAWGLHAAVGDVETHGRRTRVLVRAGLAIDPLGREIYVDREQCLDVEGLASHPIWRELSPPPGSSSPTARRAYIVLRLDDCPVPAEQAKVSSHVDAQAASRPSRPRKVRVAPTQEGFRIELCPVAPPSPSAVRSRSLTAMLGARWEPVSAPPPLALLLQEGSLTASESASSASLEAAPLLLASLDLDLVGATVFIVPGTPALPNPDSRPRAIVPSLRALAERLFGETLDR